jgi:hypothetical protein
MGLEFKRSVAQLVARAITHLGDIVHWREIDAGAQCETVWGGGSQDAS